MSTIHLDVQGMTCGGCVKSVTSALTKLPGVSAVDVDLKAGHVIINGDLPLGGDPLVLALAAAGYPAKLAPAVTATTASTPAKKSSGCCG